MKISTLTSLLLLTTGASLQAQPVVTNTTFTGPQTSLSYLNALPAWQPSFNLETSGANLTWNVADFTAAEPVSQSYFPLSTLGFFYQLVFNSPTNPAVQASHVREQVVADLGVELPVDIEVSEIYEFFRNDATGYYQVGVSFALSGFPIITPFISTDRIYSFPLSYDDRDTSYSEFLINVPLLGTYGSKGFRYNHIDAWGTLVTPGGSFDVLRVRTERLLTDTVNIPQLELVESIERPLQIDYSWISPALDGEVMRISTIGGQIILAQLYTLPLSANGNGFDGSGLTLWPNPSSEVCHLSLPANGGHVTMMDMSGRIVYSAIATSNRHDIATAGMASGIYLVRFSDPQGNVSSRRLVCTGR